MIGIFINPKKVDYKTKLEELFKKIEKNNIEFSLNNEVRQFFSKSYHYEDKNHLVKNKELIIIVGGDGTFLKLLHETGMIEGKYILVNIGYIGFLSSFTYKEFYKNFDGIISNKNKYIELSILSIKSEKNNYFAINDIVFENMGPTKLLNFNLYVDNEFYHNLRASGLILSTTTGSSAISYSTGGPIVEIGLPLIIYRSISPQFNCDPSVIFKGNHTFKVENSNSFPIIYTIDGAETIEMKPNESVEATLFKEKKCHLVLYKSKKISTILKEKLFKK
jgi:NAD+ kinase